MKKILVYGAGYVGLANGLLLSRKNEVTIVDINNQIISNLKNKLIHIDDEGCQKEIEKSTASFDSPKNINPKNFDYALLALPTNYDEESRKFNTTPLDDVIENLAKIGFERIIVIKSTIPLGYTQKQKELHPNLRIVFSPEFLREGSSFDDARKPSRIIVGNKRMQEIGELFLAVAENNPEVLYTSSTEAESIKLFANTYLAMRVAFVNELDTFAKLNGLNTEDIVRGVGLDPRIGTQYFTPSFGYGGYCLPKDSKQLKYEFNNKQVPSALFDAIVESNEKRKDFIVDQIVASGVKEYVIEGIAHKPGVKNFRNSPKLEVAKKLRDKGIKVIVKDKNYKGQTIEDFIIE